MSDEAEAFRPGLEEAAIRASVARRRIREIYHFTPFDQVPSILEHVGIHPRSVLRARGIPFNDDPLRWSNNPRKAEELIGYVSAGIARAWGMMQYHRDCVVFGIGARQLWREGTAFLGAWSSRGEISGVEDVRAREAARCFDEMFDNPNTAFPSPVPGEVLICGSVGLGEVTCVYFRSHEHQQRVVQRIRSAGISSYRGPSLQARIAPSIYGREEQR